MSWKHKKTQPIKTVVICCCSVHLVKMIHCSLWVLLMLILAFYSCGHEVTRTDMYSNPLSSCISSAAWAQMGTSESKSHRFICASIFFHVTRSYWRNYSFEVLLVETTNGPFVSQTMRTTGMLNRDNNAWLLCCSHSSVRIKVQSV